MPAIILRALSFLITPLMLFLKTTWGKITVSGVAGFVANQAGQAALKSVFRAAIVIACMFAYGALLLTFWTYVMGNSLREVFNSAPLAGAPAGVMYLVSHAFPLKFALGTVFAYIQWRFSMIIAGITFSRAVRALAGA